MIETGNATHLPPPSLFSSLPELRECLLTRYLLTPRVPPVFQSCSFYSQSVTLTSSDTVISTAKATF